MTPAASAPLDMRGTPQARGRAQAALCPDSAAAMRAQLTARLDGARDLLARPRVAKFLDAQWAFANRYDAEGIAEMAGVAEGYGVDPRALFAFLHAGQLGGLPVDGCSAWAYVDPAQGAVLVKNRDLRGPALPLQRVFRHTDPAWGGRSVLCVGSLGAPGAYSSGINSDGFALVDTQVVTTDQGVGLLRYFMMTRLLAHCASVEAAIDELRGMPQAGGGTLVLADATGAIAAVEIGHSAVAVARPATRWVARTNHFLSPELIGRLAAHPGDPGIDDSQARLATLSSWLGARQACPSLDAAAAVMASHDTPDGAGLCRHGGQAGSTTISCSIFACTAQTLHFATGNPCEGAWSRYDLARDAGVRDGVRNESGR
ncbi:C45 family autoproteolytic acyltransferase/hydolase [Limobrevibacterium gyesilva]|uniref:C45 family peptidase n=1 Tax=Limobrevibacterium gyesilva TaxID=2991712 RepID=A0AA42CHB3_9PROT|nr:C45 family peptidase [Limobrevibacterium gyesilva]MCW3474665.1 C45 family peptidase [Limobrevibacterium gyesilva]